MEATLSFYAAYHFGFELGVCESAAEVGGTFLFIQKSNILLLLYNIRKIEVTLWASRGFL
jgi:hypothetical protein